MSAALADASEREILLLLLAEMRKLNASVAARKPAAQPIAAADNRELDSGKGDPVVTRDPKKWTGPPMIGRKFSQCPVDYLEVVADFLEWKVNNPQAGKDPKFADYDRRDAARALGWIQRLNGGWVSPAGAIDPPRNGATATSHASNEPSGYGASSDDY